MKTNQLACMAVLAAVAAMAGAASEGWTDEALCNKCVWAYKLTATVRTTRPMMVQTQAQGEIGPYRKPAIVKFVGYLFGQTYEAVGTCGAGLCGCNDFREGYNLNFLLWDYRARSPIIGNEFYFKRVNRIGYADRSIAELCWELSLEDQVGLAPESPRLQFTGFGKLEQLADGQMGIRRAWGYVTGQMLAYYVENIEAVCGDSIPGEASPAHYWSLCEDAETSEVIDDPLTVVCGTWKMEWDDALVKRFERSGFSAGNARPDNSYPTHPSFRFDDW